jgi:hypothetical protein
LPTYAVVAICVVEVPTAAVGAVGVPLRFGEANGALQASALLIVVTAAPIPAVTY